jgi:DNA-binding CsgD family transcriptional regulator
MMGMDSPGSNTLPSAYQLGHAAQKFNLLEGELASTVRMWAKDEVGAAMAHQLNEPLTALLLYLHEMKARSERSTDMEAVSNSMREMVEMALRETERVCEIIERLGQPLERPVNAQNAIARGREAIDAWRQSSNSSSSEAMPVFPRSELYPLTAREGEVLALIIGGASNKAGGQQLGISPRTFECHRAHMMKKIGAKNTADLFRITLNKV